MQQKQVFLDEAMIEIRDGKNIQRGGFPRYPPYQDRNNPALLGLWAGAGFAPFIHLLNGAGAGFLKNTSIEKKKKKKPRLFVTLSLSLTRFHSP